MRTMDRNDVMRPGRAVIFPMARRTAVAGAVVMLLAGSLALGSGVPALAADGPPSVAAVDMPGMRDAGVVEAAPGETPRSGGEDSASIRHMPVGGSGNLEDEALIPEPVQLGLQAAAALMLLALAGLVLGRERPGNEITTPGFEVISPTEPRTFLPLEERNQNLDFVNKIETRGGLRISANLNKVSLSIRRYGYLMEDKNFRNALLVNRRRVRRTLLRDGDVLDLGDLTLLYRDNRQVKVVRHASVTPGEGKSQVKFERPRGPVRRGMPMLVADQSPNRVFYLTKNMVTIGRSENNDLVIKSRAVHYRHAKIERVGGQYKLQDLSLLGNTFVNNRRVEQRFLREGDEISIENHRFKFQFATKAMRDKPPQPAVLSRESDQDGEGQDAYYDQGGDEGAEETSYSA